MDNDVGKSFRLTIAQHNLSLAGNWRLLRLDLYDLVFYIERHRESIRYVSQPSNASFFAHPFLVHSVRVSHVHVRPLPAWS